MKISIGTWPADKKQKDIGAFMLLATEHGFESFGMAFFTRILGMEVPEAKELIAGTKKESRSENIHSYSTKYVFLTPSRMLYLIYSKTATCTMLRNPSKRVTSSDRVRRHGVGWGFRGFHITGEPLQ